MSLVQMFKENVISTDVQYIWTIKEKKMSNNISPVTVELVVDRPSTRLKP